MAISCKSCPTHSCFIKSYCSDNSLRILDTSKRIEQHKKNQYVFHEGNTVQGIYIIQSGKVKVINTGFQGKPQIIRFAKDGYLLGHRGVGDKYYSISAITVDDSVLCFLENNFFIQLLKSDAQLTYHLMLFYAEELRIAESRMRNLAQMTVREKAAEAILLLNNIFGSSAKNGEIVLDVCLSRSDIAELAGLNSAQITKCITELKNEGIIYTDNKRITILKPDGLYKTLSPYYTYDAFRENFSYK